MPEIKKKKDGGHDYPPFDQKLGGQTLMLSSVHCRFDCGCVMERNGSSGGPDKHDPFGDCPYNSKNPNAVKKPRKPRQKKVPAAPAQQAKEALDENVTVFTVELGTTFWIEKHPEDDGQIIDGIRNLAEYEKFGGIFGPTVEKDGKNFYLITFKSEYAERVRRWLQHNGAIEKQAS